MKYLLKTKVSMKAYNKNNWWIDSDIVSDLIIDEETIEKTLLRYRDLVNEKFYIEISKNALRNKNKMYIDTASGQKQIGYVLTGSMLLEDDKHNWKKQYIDLWVEFIAIVDPIF